jgi:histone H3/H4
MPQYPLDLAHMRRRLRKGDKGEVRGDILPIKRGADGNLSPAVPGIAREIGVGMLDMLAGTRTGDLTPEATVGLLDFMGGSAATAPLRGGSRAGIFGGELAKGADKAALERAKDIKRQGIKSNLPESEIRQRAWDETGWFQGPDNKWRFEIDDSQSVVDSAGFLKSRESDRWRQLEITEDASIIAHRAKRKKMTIEDAVKELEADLRRPVDPESIRLAKTEDPQTLRELSNAAYAQKPATGPMTVGDVIQHQPLFDQYPDLPTRPYHRMGTEGGMGTYGSYNPALDEFSVSKFYTKGGQERSTALHELQHGIQRREGFQQGGNPADIMKMPGAKAIGDQVKQEITNNAMSVMNMITQGAQKWAAHQNAQGKGNFKDMNDALAGVSHCRSTGS